MSLISVQNSNPMYPNCTHAFDALIVSCYAFVKRRMLVYGLVLIAFLSLSSDISAQCTPPSMTFKNPVLTSGLARKVGAIYRFSNVVPGVDATIQIMALEQGAQLNDMDNTTQGYYDAWQPYVTAGGVRNGWNGTSYLDWKITFKRAGTNVDSILPCLSITAIDIDGDGSRLKEFIVASTPGAYAVDPNTYLAVSFDGVNSTAVGTVLTVPNIDTSERRYMFQMNFTNVGTIYYRNGSISSKSSDDVRHTCIYFKSFFESGLITLPVRLLSFTAKTAGEGVALDWTIADETDIQHYAVQRSADGLNWSNLGKVEVAEGVRKYGYVDKTSSGKVYYRLQQTDLHSKNSYSRIVGINRPAGAFAVTMPTMVSKNIPVQLETPAAGNYNFTIYNNVGSLISQRSYAAQAGFNFVQLEVPARMAPGMYMIAVRDAKGTIVSRTRVIVQ